jgi:PAS domain S-box-containing protein
MKAFTFLTIESNPAQARLVEEAIRQTGLPITLKIAASKAEFLRKFDDLKPDLVLATDSAPDMDIIDVIQLTKSASSLVPVIVLADSWKEEAVVECLKAGAEDYVSRDKLDKLAGILARTLRRREDPGSAGGISTGTLLERLSNERQEEYFRSIIENVSDVITILDSRGVIFYESPSLEKVLGYKPEEVIGKSAFDLVHTDDLAKVKLVFAQVLQNPNVIHSTELRYNHKDGGWRLLELVGKAIQDSRGNLEVLVASRDVTERHRMADVLLEEEKRFRYVAETAADGIVGLDEKGVVIYVNPMAARLFGYEVSEIQGKPFLMLIPPDMRNAHQAGFKKYLETGERTRSWEFSTLPGLKKSGEIIPLEISFGEYQRDGRHVFTGILRDVSERQNAEKTRLKYERLAAIGELAAGMAHEIRNPVAAISASAQYLRKKSGGDRVTEENLQSILEQCKRLESLVVDTLDYSKESLAGNRQEHNLKDLLEAALKLAQIQFGPSQGRVKVRWQIPLPDLSAQVNSQRIQQVLVNLILNAFQVMPEGGNLTLSCHEESGGVCLKVEDDGPGIPDDVLPWIFQPFYTSKKNGSGLGLAISQKILLEHGGKIEVKRLSPRGTAFSLWIPKEKPGAPE